MGNPWLEHVANFRKKNSNMPYKQVLVEAKKTYKAKSPSSGSKSAIVKGKAKTVIKTTVKKGKGKSLKKGGNPLTAVTAVGDTIGNLANSIGDQVDKGRARTHEINKETGYIKVQQKANIANEEREFMNFYRDLIHQRYHDPEKLPPRLRLDRKYATNPKYKKIKDEADEKLYAYAEKIFGRSQNK
jgi:hypothetical protein